jgi:ankyrin repeat protein
LLVVGSSLALTRLLDVIQAQAERPRLNRALLQAARRGSAARIRSLLAGGADLNVRSPIPPFRVCSTGEDEARDWTPLMHAAYAGNTDVVELLLAHGAPVDARDDVGSTALILAARKGRLPVVRRLLVHGADVNATDCGGSTALIGAAWTGKAAVVRALLANGADVKARDRSGWSALGYAALSGDVATVRVLLEHGADVNAWTSFGTPLNLARLRGNHSLERVLMQAGARR